MTQHILVEGLDLSARRALLALHELALHDQPAQLAQVAGLLGVERSHAARTLAALDRLGLVWAERCRLTMRGLAVAARLSALRARPRSRAA